MIHIRLASKEDIQNIMPLYAYARKFMAANGNPHQWNGNYPASEDILKDIANGNYYVCTPDNAPEKIVGGFAFIIGREPNYAVIENGAWHSDQADRLKAFYGNSDAVAVTLPHDAMIREKRDKDCPH